MQLIGKGMAKILDLRAYDCSQPEELTNYALKENTCQQLPLPQQEPEATISLVQWQSQHTTRGHARSLIISKFTYVCTNSVLAAHQRLSGIPKIEIPYKIIRDDCHTMITEQKFKGPDGKEYPVPMGKTSILTFFTPGRKEVSGSTIVCQGEQAKLGDQLVEGVAILEQMRIEVQQIHYRPKRTSLL